MRTIEKKPNLWMWLEYHCPYCRYKTLLTTIGEDARKQYREHRKICVERKKLTEGQIKEDNHARPTS
jgi:hypothetical protein